VLAVRLNRKRLVVVLEENIYLYDISNMKLLETLSTSMNPLGIFFVRSLPHASANKIFQQFVLCLLHPSTTISHILFPPRSHHKHLPRPHMRLPTRPTVVQHRASL
jgi:hypothetical protein